MTGRRETSGRLVAPIVSAQHIAPSSKAMPNVLMVQRIGPHYRLRLFQALSRLKDIRFYVSYGEARPSDSLQSVFPTHINYLPVTNYWLTKRGPVLWQSRVLHNFLSKKVDIVILEANPYVISSVMLCMFAFIFRKKVLLWGHGVGSKKNWLVRIMKVVIPRLLGGFVFYDRDRASQLVMWGLPKRNVFVVNNSVDTEVINTLALEWKKQKRKNILFIGRFIIEKRLELLIQGFSLAKDKLPSYITLTLVGDGPERANLSTLVHDLKLELKVRFMGEMTNESDLAEIFNDSWVSVSPGRIGLSAVHSLAYGVPLLVADAEQHSPEIALLQNQQTGVYFKSLDPLDLANKLIDMWNDPLRLERMSDRGRRLIEGKYSIGTMAQEFRLACFSVLGCRE